MKTKILMSVLAIGMAIALIGGATMAWFTDDAEVTAAEFTAGTVEVDVDAAPRISMGEKRFLNVNPGDCGVVTWKIKNTGTKAAQYRVKLDKEWTSNINVDNNDLWKKLKADLGHENFNELLEELDPDSVYYAPHPDSPWVMNTETNSKNEKEIWLYYVGDIENGVRGTFKSNNPEERRNEKTVELKLVVYFDGSVIDNNYMGANFMLNGTVEAVQASNGAPAEVFGNGWSKAISGGYPAAYGSLAKNYLSKVAATPCYSGGSVEDPGPVGDGKVSDFVHDFNVSVSNDFSTGKTTTTIGITGTITAIDEEDDSGNVMFTGNEGVEIVLTLKRQGGNDKTLSYTENVEFNANGEGSINISDSFTTQGNQQWEKYSLEVIVNGVEKQINY